MGSMIVSIFQPEALSNQEPPHRRPPRCVQVSVSLPERSQADHAVRCERIHAGLLTWDGPPPLATVETLLSGSLGREIRAISELDIVD